MCSSESRGEYHNSSVKTSKTPELIRHAIMGEQKAKIGLYSDRGEGMYRFTSAVIDLDAIRERIKKMNDDRLLAYGRSAAWMVERSGGETWKVQLAEARAEWRRRFKKPSNGQPG